MHAKQAPTIPAECRVGDGGRQNKMVILRWLPRKEAQEVRGGDVSPGYHPSVTPTTTIFPLEITNRRLFNFFFQLVCTPLTCL